MKRINSENIYLSVALEIANKLCKEAIWYKNKCNWICPAMDPKSLKRFYTALDPFFYEGISGISFFLSNLYAITNESVYKKTALAAYNCVNETLTGISQGIPNSFYLGSPGIAFSLISGGENLGCNDLINEGFNILNNLPKLSKDLDVINGVAGTIPLYLFLGAKYFRKDYLQLAISQGDYLLSVARKSDKGYSWETLPQSGVINNLTGFAHGTAGISYALLKLFENNHDRRYLIAAREALRYENYYYDEGEMNWQDLRKLNNDTNNKPKYSVAWCHGAPGISMVRAKAFAITNEFQYEKEAVLGCAKTVSGFDIQGYNYSLCHGQIGNAETLIICGRLLGNSKCMSDVQNCAMTGYKKFHITNLPWPSGLKTQEETFGFMTGLSGIGNFYLMLALPDKKRFPSVLLLE